MTVKWYLKLYFSVRFSSVAQSCPTLCDPMNCSTPGLPVHRQLLEFTQTHVHREGDGIQLSHPLSSPSPPAPILNHLNECINFKLSSSILRKYDPLSYFSHYSSKNSLPPFKYRGGLIKPIATVNRFQWNG